MRLINRHKTGKFCQLPFTSSSMISNISKRGQIKQSPHINRYVHLSALEKYNKALEVMKIEKERRNNLGDDMIAFTQIYFCLLFYDLHFCFLINDHVVKQHGVHHGPYICTHSSMLIEEWCPIIPISGLNMTMPCLHFTPYLATYAMHFIITNFLSNVWVATGIYEWCIINLISL